MISTKTGLKLFFITDTISEIQVNDGTIISFLLSLFFIAEIAATDKKFADDPEFTKTLYFVPSHLDQASSNFFTFL